MANKIWCKVKTWVKKHRYEIILGTLVVGSGAVIGIDILKTCKEAKEAEHEGEIILDTLTNTTTEFDEYNDMDRYVVDGEMMNKLEPGEYDVFDMYENERVKYVVEPKSTTEAED